MNLIEQLMQMSKEARNLLRREYPPFVFQSNPLYLDFIPIFAYHRVDPIGFESDLRFLQINGYRTLTGNDYLAWLNGENGNWKNCVFLTFDDGMSSVFTYGLPILKKFGMHAIIFLITGYIRDYANEKEPRCRDEQWNPLVSWEEIDLMKSSGCFSFGSHTSFHHPIFTSDDLVDFCNPRYNSLLFDIPVEKGSEIELLESDLKIIFGRPIYRYDHFMQANCVYSNEIAKNACIEHVQKNAGKSFFNRSSWEKELTGVATRYKNLGRTLKKSEIRALILADLVDSRKLIEKKIGREIHHLCYPYGAGSDLSITLSREAGFKTNIWQTLPFRNKNFVGCDPFRLVRLKKDFLRRLPGKNRRKLVDIYWLKFKRRIEGKPYH